MNADWKSGAGRQLQAANQQITLCQGMIANDRRSSCPCRMPQARLRRSGKKSMHIARHTQFLLKRASHLPGRLFPYLLLNYLSKHKNMEIPGRIQELGGAIQSCIRRSFCKKTHAGAQAAFYRSRRRKIVPLRTQ